MCKCQVRLSKNNNERTARCNRPSLAGKQEQKKTLPCHLARRSKRNFQPCDLAMPIPTTAIRPVSRALWKSRPSQVSLAGAAIARSSAGTTSSAARYG